MKTQNSKIIAFVLVFALMITTVIITSVANAKTTDIQITADKTEIKAGESATISVKVTTNYPVATMSIPVYYDKTLVDVSDATAVLTGYTVAETTTDSKSVDAAKVYENTEIDSNEFGFVLATYIAGANKDVAELIDSVVLTFKITAKADISGDAAIKVVKESAKTNTNVEGMLYFGASTSGTKITEVPENVENIDLTEAIENIVISKETKSNTLKLNENAPFEAIIDYDNNLGGEYTGTVYGFDTLGYNVDGNVDGAIADFLTTAYGDDYLEIILPECGFETSGTVINVLDEEGNVVESYMYILFGDMDKDGAIGFSDSAMAFDWEMLGEGIESADVFMAGDLDYDGAAGFSDSAVMFDWEMLGEYITPQSELGANVYGNIVYEF